MTAILIGRDDSASVGLDPHYGNRHGTIAGATGSAAGADPAAGSTWSGTVHDALFGARRRQGSVETMGKRIVCAMGSQLGRQTPRGVLGGISGGRH